MQVSARLSRGAMLLLAVTRNDEYSGMKYSNVFELRVADHTVLYGVLCLNDVIDINKLSIDKQADNKEQAWQHSISFVHHFMNLLDSLSSHLCKEKECLQRN